MSHGLAVIMDSEKSGNACRLDDTSMQLAIISPKVNLPPSHRRQKTRAEHHASKPSFHAPLPPELYLVGRGFMTQRARVSNRIFMSSSLELSCLPPSQLVRFLSFDLPSQLQSKTSSWPELNSEIRKVEINQSEALHLNRSPAAGRISRGERSVRAASSATMHAQHRPMVKVKVRKFTIRGF